VLGLIGKWYLWPAIRNRDPQTALTPLLLYACLRVNGLMFLMPGLVSASLPSRLAVPTASGDVLAALRRNMRVALFLVWVFNVEAYANLATFTAHVDPAQLGVSYDLAVLNVPAMIVVHIIIFVYLRGPARRTASAAG